MSVTDFECAIAKSQIGRYISGENLAPEIARQLESHINNCARCKQLLQEKKNSLEAMIADDQETIEIQSAPIPMSSGTSALKTDYMEELAESARRSLREKLGEVPRLKKDVVEIPVVANAFAYKDEEVTETIRLEIPSEKPSKKRFNLSALALYKNVPDEGTKPAMNMENIRAAKAVIRNNNPSMMKPTLYLAGLCAVVGAMSFVLRDPTNLFGSRASEKTAKVAPASNPTKKLSKKPATKYAKVVPHQPVQLNDAGTDAAMFSTEAPASKPKAKPKSKPQVKASKSESVDEPMVTKSPVLTKKNSVKKSKPKSHSTKVTTKAQRFSLNSKPAARHHVPAAKKKSKPTSTQNTVKLYTPDQTPDNKEQK